MDFILNEISLHGQFNDISEFEESLDEIMKIRNFLRKNNSELKLTSNWKDLQITHDFVLSQIISRLNKSKSQALMSWIGRTAPFWDIEKKHSEDDYYECNDQVVTSSSIAECAHLNNSGVDTGLVSSKPSDWEGSPLIVELFISDDESLKYELTNHTSEATISYDFNTHDSEAISWKELEERCRMRLTNLNFSDDSFNGLTGVPFNRGAAKSMFDVIKKLSEFKSEHGPEGRSSLGDEIYTIFFQGGGSWFSDSSDTEKLEFKKDLTFRHPDDPTKTIFTPYHGKVQTPQLRVHFSWPVTASDPLFVTYVGTKITKR
jgi:hypothetical protein